MRICIFTSDFLPGVGGSEIFIDGLARRLHARGHHVVVLAKGRPQTLDVPYPVRWFRMPPMQRWFPERIAGHLLRLHREHRFDVFLTNYAHPTGYAALRAGRRVGVPTVVASQGGDVYTASPHRRHPHIWRRTIHTYRHAQGLIFISPYIEGLVRDFAGHALPPIARIPNAVDAAAVREPAQRPADFPDHGPFALCLANLRPEKRIVDILDALALGPEVCGEVPVVIVGKGRAQDELHARAAALNLGPRVQFVGERTGNDKRWFLQNCLYGLIPSAEEGHPLVALELLAAGKPIIASEISAFDGVVEPGVNGLRVPVGQPRPLAHAMASLHASDLAAMGEASRGRSAAYDWDAIVEAYLAFLDATLQAHAAATGTPGDIRA